MNKKKRDRLAVAKSNLDIAYEIVNDVRDEESDSLDNIPDNLEGSDRYEAMENCIDSLEDASSSICDAIELINAVI